MSSCRTMPLRYTLYRMVSAATFIPAGDRQTATETGGSRLGWLISCVNLTGLKDAQIHGKMKLAILMATVQHQPRKRRDPLAWGIYIQ